MLGASSPEKALGSSSQAQGSPRSLKRLEFLLPPMPDEGVLLNPLVACLNECLPSGLDKPSPESAYSFRRKTPVCLEKKGKGIPRKCGRGSGGSALVISTGWYTPKFTRRTPSRTQPHRLQGLHRAAAIPPAEAKNLDLTALTSGAPGRATLSSGLVNGVTLHLISPCIS